MWFFFKFHVMKCLWCVARKDSQWNWAYVQSSQSFCRVEDYVTQPYLQLFNQKFLRHGISWLYLLISYGWSLVWGFLWSRNLMKVFACNVNDDQQLRQLISSYLFYFFISCALVLGLHVWTCLVPLEFRKAIRCPPGTGVISDA